ncbi:MULTISPECIES: hypothetical protein [Clostridium]|uniref:FeS cluster biogenesis domain-containing protein n=1 Tax=Clostridium faecium TaxID=2762223 RepID=A0ABR8YRC9_9CLOT|nr:MULTISPECIES: hypothetical protein [Clostridium]MBD8046814.1 hypothetical protein [Clostridium faecium]MDU1348680.1 hypothetical protein [Clostridium argentinense]
MHDKPKIRISNTAYENLIFLLKNHTEYDSIRFKYTNGCCRSSRVEILLDNKCVNDTIDNVEDLNIVYDNEVTDYIKEIILTYKNNSFMVKTILKDGVKNTCNKKLSGNCNGCNKKCNLTLKK